MKFRVSSKDLIMFVVFVVFLLYLCAITTANISSFGTTATFSGLNPILGLTKYLGATLVLFIIFLVVIFTSVSSYIFDRKKGIGFELGEKESKGYSRWCKEKEMKGDKGVEIVDPLVRESNVAGIPLVNDGKHLWVDNGEYHNLVIGSTGSGKSQTVVEPMVELLIKKGESMIITDPKGELFKAASVYMQERGYNVVVLNFREPQNGNAWNPLTLPYQYYKDGNFDKATELLDDVALNILYDPNNKSGDPFWEKSAADYFSGLALGLFEDAAPDEINLNSINYMSTVGEEKFAASTFIKEYFTLKGEASNAYVFASNTINSPTDTKGGILSVFRQKIRLFASRENLSEMLSYSDFDMRNIGKEKTAVFIIIHDEKTTYHGLATIFIKQCYETLIDVAQANGGKLPFRTNFILDEFANMPPLKDVTTMVTAARSRAIRFTFIIQNFAQLKSVYGNEDAETIKGNCGNLIYLISTELAALEEISKMCGEVKSDDKDKTASTPLVTVTDLQKLKLFEAIIIRWRLSPFKTKYTPNFQMDWGHPKFEAEYPVRKKRDIKLFDVKEYTKKKKGDKIKSSLNEKSSGLGGTNPFKNSTTPNPFGAKPSVSPFGAPPQPQPSAPLGSQTTPKNEGGLFSGLSGGIDLDAMMKDIDRKIAELDAEEARQKAEQEKMKAGEVKPTVSQADLPNLNANSTNPFSNPVTNNRPVGPSLTPFTQPVSEPVNAGLPSNSARPNMVQNAPSNLPKAGGVSLLDDRLGGGLFDTGKVPVVESNEAINNKPTMPVNPFEERKPVQEPISSNNMGPFNNPVNTASNPLPSQMNQNNDLDLFNTPVIEATSPNNLDKFKNFNSLNNTVTPPKIAVATSSPLEDDDFKFDGLPKVEQASVIQPTINSGTVVKANDQNDYNIYNSVPNIIDSVKDDTFGSMNNLIEEKIETPSIMVNKNDVNKLENKLNDYNIYNQSSKDINNNFMNNTKENNIGSNFNNINENFQDNKVSSSNNINDMPTVNYQNAKTISSTPVSSSVIDEKPNVNVDPDKIIIDSNNTISDDEFFDDFFGD